MNTLDWLILLGTMLGIAAYGAWHTRHTDNLNTYLKGNASTGWGTIGLSVMATQASAITFLSIPGQGFESGIGFVQNYFGLPLALIIVCAVFLPLYRRLDVYTAYEFLGHRFDRKTRLLGAGLFLMQRGLAAGVTIYAPAIILSTVLGWRLDLTIICTGLLVIVYTVTGGSVAVSLTQKWQMLVIFGGMITAFIVLLTKLPAGLGFHGAAEVAGAMGKLQAVDFSLDPDRRYTLWSGLLGGLFLSLSYFGTDQSQVQRYIGGARMREGRLGLMFNAVLKIPMQFFILLLGALVFVFYQFQPAPVFYNRVEWQRHAAGPNGAVFRSLEERHATLHAEKHGALQAWLAAKDTGDSAAVETAHAKLLAADAATNVVRAEAKTALLAVDPRAHTKDSDYVFIGFILAELPHGAIGLLIAVMIAAALGSKAGELNALGTTSTIDFWRVFRPLAAHDERRNVRVAKWFTAFWGLFAISFALFASFAENLIEAINILGSIFYGVVLGIFLVAFFLKRVGGTAVFWAAVAAQTLVFILYASLTISYLWYNLIGCAACMLFSLLLHAVLHRKGLEE
ncbi:sodium:solute symporter [Opitutus terrae]|uniref:Na+/solute symporter n=1 Tax=Opitutus terrae (strain DSM 11246 / JCM 15787 / PB90-1) TaxID=452637 RepID=B1ZU08_OPITP|nr:sodium:solute symporter [Opitutus terrae]ACB75890.1 Na+/solute symporter [Opitutus terrae PB90-1]